MEHNQTSNDERMQEPEGLAMAGAILEAIARAAQDDAVYAQVFEIVRENIADPEVRAQVDQSEAEHYITTTTALVVYIGTALAMLRQTPPTVLVNLCGMLLARMMDTHLAEIGFRSGGAGHRKVTNLILDRTRELAPELLDGVRAQPVH